MNKTIQFTISEKEAKQIKNCLDYVYHRLRVHKKKIPFIKLQEVNKLRKELDVKS